MNTDFTGRNALNVCRVRHDGGYLIALSQFGGAMHFQHSMTPAQARQLASALTLMANDIEPVKANDIEVTT